MGSSSYDFNADLDRPCFYVGIFLSEDETLGETGEKRSTEDVFGNNCNCYFVSVGNPH